MEELSKLKVAIVCDWLLGIGGAERVVLELHRMFPEAPIYTSQYNPKNIDWFKNAEVRTTWLQKLPSGLKKFLPVLRAWAFSHLDLSEYDLVISSSGAEAKGIKTGANTLHINYCHSPTHYYWIRYNEYLQQPGFGAFNWLAHLGLKLLVKPMRRWDYKAAMRPDLMIANSRFTQENIKKFYGREAAIIHPPVDIKRFAPKQQIARHGFITVGRQTPYMRKDLAVTACSKLGLPLTVIGHGPEHEKLKKIAGPTITFLTDITDKDLPQYLRVAKAFILPGKEDFGIVGVEAMAAGTPVIAYRAGGALDYVIPSKTGEFFTKQTVTSLVTILKKFETITYKEQVIREEAELFDAQHFHQAMHGYIRKSLNAKSLI